MKGENYNDISRQAFLNRLHYEIDNGSQAFALGLCMAKDIAESLPATGNYTPEEIEKLFDTIKYKTPEHHVDLITERDQKIFNRGWNTCKDAFRMALFHQSRTRGNE